MSGNEVYGSLRNRALALTRSEASIAAPAAGAPIWGLLMETGYEKAEVTLLALVDGTTSIYFSTGGAVIGGQTHESVRKANTGFLSQANRSRALMQKASGHPLPTRGQVLFYALTDAGVLTASAGEEDLGYNRHELSPLFHAGHEVIAALWEIADKGDGTSRKSRR